MYVYHHAVCRGGEYSESGEGARGTTLTSYTAEGDRQQRPAVCSHWGSVEV